jgi:hypothetical protein
MDGRRQAPLSDAALDRELDAALGVEPSPEFVARVRMRVADQAVPAGWLSHWRLVSAGAGAIALAVAAGLWSMDGNVGAAFRRPEPSSTVSRIARDVTLPAAVVALAPPPVMTGAPVAAASQTRRAGRVATRNREIALDDVIVSAEDRRGFEALLVAIEERRLPLLPQQEPAVDSAPPVPIEIPDVTIEPLELLRLE